MLLSRDGARDSCNWAWTSVLAGGTPAVGARALVPLLRLKVRCRLGEATFTRTDGNGRRAGSAPRVPRKSSRWSALGQPRPAARVSGNAATGVHRKLTSPARYG